MAQSNQEELHKKAAEIVEYWDFSPLQDEDSRIKRLTSQITDIINQEVLAVLDRIESSRIDAESAMGDVLLIDEAIEKERERYGTK